MLAITVHPSPFMARGQRTHVARVAIDQRMAGRQHAAYCQMLRDCGVDVIVLDVSRDLPDGVFVEDTAVVFDEAAVLTSMGTEARRHELAGIEPELQKYRLLHRIESPANIEGGDVLRVDRTFLVGLSARTNRAGIEAF